MKEKKAILVVSPGTANLEAIKGSIEIIEKEFEKNFTEYDIIRAFNSQSIIERLKAKHGVAIKTLTEALEWLVNADYHEVIIQPLNIIPGMDYECIRETSEKFITRFSKISLGKPLLYDSKDYQMVVEAIKFQIPELTEGEAVLLLGHGSKSSSKECYFILQGFLEMKINNVYTTTLDEISNLSAMIDKFKAAHISKVLIMPFMLTAGNHTVRDIASDERNSWKTLFLNEGFKVETYLHGLGENSEIRKLYIEKIKEEIKN